MARLPAGRFEVPGQSVQGRGAILSGAHMSDPVPPPDTAIMRSCELLLEAAEALKEIQPLPQNVNLEARVHINNALFALAKGQATTSSRFRAV